ncbi:MAG: hypothetical protein IPF46_16125 [Saprospiraceae bacterium]|nr:hypothetical protein [Candidatus Vicinibacter affinis]
MKNSNIKILDILSKDKGMQNHSGTPAERIFNQNHDGQLMKDLISSIISQQCLPK